MKRLTREALARLRRSDLLGLAELCLLPDHRPEARRELAERLAQCNGARLAMRPHRFIGMERRQSIAPSVRCVHLRFRDRDKVRTDVPLLVAATTDAWRLVPAFGLLSGDPADVEKLSRSLRPNVATVTAIVCALIACPSSFLPYIGVLAGVFGVLAVVFGVMGYGDLLRRRGPAVVAGLAVVLGSIAIVVAAVQAVGLWVLYALPPTIVLR